MALWLFFSFQMKGTFPFLHVTAITIINTIICCRIPWLAWNWFFFMTLCFRHCKCHHCWQTGEFVNANISVKTCCMGFQLDFSDTFTMCRSLSLGHIPSLEGLLLSMLTLMISERVILFWVNWLCFLLQIHISLLHNAPAFTNKLYLYGL